MTTTVTKYTVVIAETHPDFFLVTCGNCGGDGCGYCDRIGKRRLTVPSDWVGEDVGVLKCGNCRGDGCGYCNQIGAYVGIFPRVICGNCKGNGCGYCNQRGSRWIGNVK